MELNFWIAVTHVAVVIAGVVGFYWLINSITKCVDQEQILVRHNEAYLRLRQGMVLGPVIATITTVPQGMHYWGSVGWVALAFCIGAFWSVVGHWVVDWIFLSRRTSAFDDTNVSIATAKLGFSVAMGIVTAAAFIGSAPNRVTGLVSLGVFTSLAAAGLLLTLTAFSTLLRIKAVSGSRTSLRQHLLSDNPAAGWYALAALVPASFVLGAAMAGDFTTWGDSLKGFGLAVAVALVGSLAGALFIDLTILTGKGFTLWGILDRRETSGAKLLLSFMVAATLPVALVVNQYVA